MKKVTLLIAAFLLIFTFWVIEPFSYNPFHQMEAPLVNSSIKYNCKFERKLQESADSKLEQYMQSNNFLGVSVGFSKENCGVYVASSGYSNKRDLVKINSDTISRIASITKPMTAIAIMQLYEQGLIDLDSPIQAYLPNFPTFSKNSITVRQLLNHTSGISHYESKLDAISFSKYSTLSSAVDLVVERGLVNEPGERFIYSSFGYTVLGAIIERVSKQSFEYYMSKNIWQKAGMKNTSLERDHSYPNKSRLYVKVGSVYIRSPYTDLSVIYPAGGVQSTVEDLLKFGKAILNDKLISSQTLEMMIDISNSLSPMAGDDPYGLGWSVYNDSKKGISIAHSGGQPGASAYFKIYLDQKIVIATLSNAFGTKSSVYSLSKDMVNLIL